MPQERLTLRKISEILRLKHEAGLSNRAIATIIQTCHLFFFRYHVVTGPLLARVQLLKVGAFSMLKWAQFQS